MSSKKNEIELFEVFKNVLQMLNIRGYIIPPENNIENYSKLYNSGFENYYANLMNLYIKDTFPNLPFLLKLSNVYEHSTLKVLNCNGEVIKKICIVFYLNVSSDISTDIFKRLMDIIDNFKCDTNDVIIISNYSFTANTLKPISSNQITHTIQLFLYSEICYNFTTSCFGPSEYILFDIEQSEQFLTKNSLNKHNLPAFCSDSPIVKYYGAKPGQIFKCMRRSVIDKGLIDRDIFYRIVSTKKMDK